MSEIDKKLEEVANVVNGLHSQQRHQEHQAILDWLTPIDYGLQQTDYIRKRQQGTGQWLLDSSQFHAWRETDKQTLFCPGIPGAGKTVLASIIINHLSERFHTNAGIGMAYIYFNYKQNVDNQNVENLLSSILKQLSQERSLLPDSVKALHDQYRKKRTRPSIDELSRALQSVAALYSRVFIIVDALDECQVTNGCRARFLTEIFNLQTKTGVNLFATSRFIPEITEMFKGSTSLEIRASEEDVRRYLEGHMSKLPTFVRNSSDLQEEVKAGIVKAVDGM